MAKKSSDSEKETDVRMPKQSVLKKLLASARSAFKDNREISGTFGAEIKDAAENERVHKKAFKSVQAADRMEPDKLADYFAHRDYYEEVLGLRKRAADAPRLGLDDNVTEFPKQHSVAAE